MASTNIDRSRFRDIDNDPPPNHWRDCYPIPWIGPDGKFGVTFFSRKEVDRGELVRMGLTPVVHTPDAQSRFSVAKWAHGYVIYEDACNGKVPGIDASPKHWKLWQALAKMYARGQAPARGALQAAAKKLELSDVLHPEVKRRRSLVQDGGMFALSADEILKLYGVDVEETDEFEIEED